MHNIFPKLFSQGRSTTFLLGPQAMLILPRALLHPYSFQDPYSFCAPCCSLNRLSPMTTSITTWQKKHGFLDQSVLDSNSGHSFPNSIFGWVIKFLRSKMKLLLFFSHLVMSDSLQPPGLQHARPPWPSLSLGVCSNSCLLNRWCIPTISSSVIPFSSCPPSFSASGSFPMSWLFASGGQNIGASASVFPMNIQGWFPLGLTEL